MEEREYTTPISIRIPISLLQILDKMIEEKKFKDRTEALLTLIQDGIQFKKIITMINDPKQVKKAIKKIKKIEAVGDVKNTLKNFEPHELSLIAKIAKSLEEEKVQQTYLDMKG
ncbi:MAG: ribbon-helix-helix domain-containing protein [Thaumarchaeota archaeon]|nr:ribbon-helix-helix domain-containing protein [Nitrososphaerota archaeon]